MARELAALYQRSGLARACARNAAFCSCSVSRASESCCRKSTRNFSSASWASTFPATGTRRARVAFFAGCVAQVTFSELNRATIRVLQANGCEVVVPDAQGCCGALAAHAGVRDTARELAEKNFAAFLGDNFDAIITNAAGCGSTAQGVHTPFDTQSADHDKAARFSAKVRDVTEFLADLGLTAQDEIRAGARDVSRLVPPRAWTEDSRSSAATDACDSRRRRSWRCPCPTCAVDRRAFTTSPKPGLRWSCSTRRWTRSRQTKADVIVTANPGCILQLRAGVAKRKTGQEVMHVVELIDQAIEKN